MPDTIAPPVHEPATRRARGSATDPGGGGGKILILILTLLLAGAGYLLYRQNAAATAQAEADAKAAGALTNQLDQLRTKLALEQSNVAVAQSNQQALQQRWSGEFVNMSNRYVQTSLLLSHQQAEKQAAQAELPAKAVAIAALEAQRDDLQRQLTVIPALQRDLAETKAQADEAVLAQAALQESLGKSRMENAELDRKLQDLAFLRLQAKRVAESAEIRQRTAAGQRINNYDRRVRLELQPDGTVQPAVTASIQTGN